MRKLSEAELKVVKKKSGKRGVGRNARVGYVKQGNFTLAVLVTGLGKEPVRVRVGASKRNPEDDPEEVASRGRDIAFARAVRAKAVKL